MKNTIKMSLVAALAVAGLSSTASAGSLEEAIKGVSISGKMEVEYDYTNEDSNVANTNEVTTDDWDLDWDITAKIPVNDNVTAVFGMEGDTYNSTRNNGGIVTGSAAGDDRESTVNVTKVYFQYANGPVTAMVGKQGIGAPWFDDERGNGVKALFAAGPVTLAAAHFTGSNASAGANTVNSLSTATTPFAAVALGNTDISAAAVIGSMGPVNAQLWYANLSGITALSATPDNQLDADSWALLLDAKFDIVNVGLKYAQADYDLTTPGAGYNGLDDDAEMLQVSVSADFGVATPYIAYGQTDSKQGGAGLDLTNDTDSTLDFGSEILSIDDLDDAQAWLIGVTIPVNNWTFDVSYVTGEYDDYSDIDTAKDTAYGCDFDEFLVQVDYKMSKNFTIGAHYSVAEMETQTAANAKVSTDYDNAAVSLEYKF